MSRRPGRPGLAAGGAAAWVVLLLAWWGPRGVAAAGESDTFTLPLEQEFRLVASGNSPLQLSHEFVDPTSVRVFVDGRLWQRERDYRVRARSGLVVPLRDWASTPADSSRDGSRTLVMVSYAFQPLPLAARRDLRPVATDPALAGGSARPGLFAPPAPVRDWRTGDLRVSGSKTVQVASGSRREMTVDQNLRLTIVGQLTPDIAVRAFLSDDNLPVVPEGNTEQLRDIDKVLVELTARRWRATLGDFVARREGTAFGNYRRKLQGVSLQSRQERTDFEVLAGSPRGLYRTLQIRGQESNQGPYFLGGSSAAGNLFIVAGSERVTLDGQKMVRGAERDYVIDYVAGTLTFTYRRLVTAESTIVVEFEEGEGAFARTVVGAGGGVRFALPWLGVPTRVGARVIREKDDPSRLRTGELGPDDESILRAAGDDQSLAVAGGVTATEPGAGAYDSATSNGKTIYVFNEAGGDFNLDLFYVGPGQGDYELERLTSGGQRVFRYAGDGLGGYLIGRPIPLPSKQSIATLRADLGDTVGSFLAGEWNAGVNDLNQLSSRDNQDNDGAAGRLQGRLRLPQFRLGATDLGAVGVTGSWERRDGQFKPFQVHKTIFDYDEWGLDDRARRPGFLEQEESETRLAGNWQASAAGRELQLTGSVGRLHHGSGLSARQSALRAQWRLWGGRGRHLLQDARADDTGEPLAIRRTNRRHELSWNLGPIVPSAHHRLRRWRDAAAGGGGAAGFRLVEYGGGLAARPGSRFGWHLDFTRALADSLAVGDWRLERDSRTTRAGVTTGRFGGMRLVGEGTLRETRRPGAASETTRLARANLAGKWDRTASDWSLGYRVENSRTEVLDRQLVFVGERQGDFNIDGVFLGTGQGEYDLILAGTDSLVATTGVTADLNWRQGFDFLGAGRWFGAWSAMTLASIESRSTTDDVGGLLALDPAVIFDRRSAVLGDLNLSEELTFLRHLRTVDLRTRFAYRETVDRQFADHPEDRTNRIWQVTGNLNLTRHSSVKLRWQQEGDRRYTTENSLSARSSLVLLARRYEVGWNYSPSTNVRLGLQGEYLTRVDRISTVSQTERALRPTGRARLRRAWTLQGDFRFADVRSVEQSVASRPFFFAQPGTNIESSLRLAWEPSGLMSVSASWFARKRGQRRWQHDIRLETTARF